MTDMPPILSLWNDDFEDPAGKIWFMCQHLDHLAKMLYEHPDARVATMGWELMDVGDMIQRHLDVLSPPPDDEDPTAD